MLWQWETFKCEIKTDGLQTLHMKITSSCNESLFLCALMMEAIAPKFEFGVVYIWMITVKMQHQINLYIFITVRNIDNIVSR